MTEMLRLTPAQWEAICAHLSQALPNEACGLLGGEAGQVRAVYPVENRLHSPVRYEMAPAAQLAAMLAIEAAGWEITGIFHSHPRGPATPSETDVAEAYYPESIYLICAPGATGAWQGRAFRLEAGRVREVTVRVE